MKKLKAVNYKHKILIFIGLAAPPILCLFFFAYFRESLTFILSFFSDGNKAVEISQFYVKDKVLFIILSSALFSETAVFPLFFLSAYGTFAPADVAIFSFVGVLLADIFWYFIGSHSFFALLRFFSKKDVIEKVARVNIPLINEKPFYILMINKFLNIPAFVAISYLKSKNIKFMSFMLCEISGLIFWLLALMVIGWLAGHGSYLVYELFKDMRVLVLLALIFYLAFKLFERFLNRKFLRFNIQQNKS